MEKNFTLCWQSVIPIQIKKLVKKNVIWINMYLYKSYCNALKISLFVIYMELWIHMNYTNQSLHSQHSRARLNACANYKISQMPHADTVGIGLSRLQISICHRNKKFKKGPILLRNKQMSHSTVEYIKRMINTIIPSPTTYRWDQWRS